MSQIIKVSGKRRENLGTASTRRLRGQGLVPCNVYGHKQDPASITVDGDQIGSLIKSGSRVIDLEVDGKVEKALLKNVQWDTFSAGVLHVDFLRVNVGERVKIQVPLQMKGTAPGVVAGGTMEIPHHTLEVECLAIQAPEFIQVRVGGLNIGDAVHVRDLQDVPEGVTIVTAPEVVLVHVIEPKSAPEPVAGAEAPGAEPALVNPPKEKEASK